MEVKESKCQAIPLFKRLSKFSTNFNRELSAIKNELKMSPGTYSKNYYVGLNCLKSEMDTLKDLQKTADEKIEKVAQFGYFLNSTKELLQELEGDLSCMEKYLEKFGYSIPEFKMEEEEKLESCEEKSITEEQLLSNLDLQSPELSRATTTLTKQVKTQFECNSAHPVKTSPPLRMETETKTMLTTPVQKSGALAWYASPTPNMSTKEKVSRWIKDIEVKAAQEITPLFQRQRSQRNGEICDLPRSKLMKLPDYRKGTPEEPEISSATALLLKEESTHTPEEPQLSSAMDHLFHKKPADTLEEPHISSVKESLLDNKENTTPEEPLLYHQSKSTRSTAAYLHQSPMLSTPIRGVPESPQLSDLTQKILNINSMRFSEQREDTESPVPHKQKYLDINAPSCNFVPNSPELSECTQKILLKRN